MNTYTVKTIKDATEEYVIYRLTFANGQQYIGKAAHLLRRIETHIGALICGTHNRFMQEAFTILDDITIEVIEQCTKDTYDIRERELIAQFQPYLNIKHGKHGSTLDQRQRMSAVKKGKRLSEEHRKKIGEGQKGKPRIVRGRYETDEEFNLRLTTFLAQYPNYIYRRRFIAKEDRV